MMMLASARSASRTLSFVSRSSIRRQYVGVSSVTSSSSSSSTSTSTSSCRRWMSTNDDDLPYHLVVGMPALSPTMDQGNLTSWHVKEGDTFGAGDSLAEIETDKATIAFEAQDDGCVAKIIVPEGTPDVAVGTPIMITVEEEDDVAAFANYEPPAPVQETETETETAPPALAPAPVPKEEPVVAAAPPTPVETTPPPPPAADVVEPAVAAASAMLMTPTMAPAWGSTSKVTSPIAKTLAATQQKYVETYGTTGQLTL
mmetsp:Transcript_15260/g.23751  ORF Transcript_15260/g.23751 Transcript_15260/m.23751 type:complete len:257 (+) Transcript_15260:98-868(+)